MRALVAWLILLPVAFGEVVEVKDAAELRTALAAARGGDVIRIAGGDYPGGHFVSGVRGLTVEAADPENPPHFKGSAQAFHFSRCPDLKLRHLRVSGQTANGINLDDGGPENERVTGIVLENLHVSDIGPSGNHDGIKCSGLADLVIRDCTIEGWGGQAIDLVGCHRVRISGCRFVGKPGFSQHTGPQAKGGSEEVTIENCTFVDAGMRPIQAGGSTGTDYFCPPGAKYEARRIFVRGNRIEGGDCACAFTGVDGAEFTGNTIIRPRRWIFRILTENDAEGFPPARNVVVSANTIVFRRDEISSVINIGAGTAPETFRFSGNRWYAEDAPDRSRPDLPVEETGGIYGEKPQP